MLLGSQTTGSYGRRESADTRTSAQHDHVPIIVIDPVPYHKMSTQAPTCDDAFLCSIIHYEPSTFAWSFETESYVWNYCRFKAARTCGSHEGFGALLILIGSRSSCAVSLLNPRAVSLHKANPQKAAKTTKPLKSEPWNAHATASFRMCNCTISLDQILGRDSIATNTFIRVSWMSVGLPSLSLPMFKMTIASVSAW